MGAPDTTLFVFLRHPVENPPADLRTTHLLRTFGWFCLLQLVSLLGYGLFALLSEANLPFRDGLNDNSLRGILLAVLFAPLLEETMFRLPLRRNRTTGLIALSVSLFWIISLCVVRQPFSIERLPLRLVLTLCAVSLLWHLVRRFAVRIRFPGYFFLLAALFAGAHLYNIEFHTLHVSFPVLAFLAWFLAEKFIAGTLYGYARMTHGFAAACCLHACNNAIPCVLLMVSEQIFGT